MLEDCVKEPWEAFFNFRLARGIDDLNAFFGRTDETCLAQNAVMKRERGWRYFVTGLAATHSPAAHKIKKNLAARWIGERVENAVERYFTQRRMVKGPCHGGNVNTLFLYFKIIEINTQ